MEKKKMKMSQDELYEYLTKHDVKISRIAEIMRKDPSVVISDFRHHLNNKGNARRFSVENIQLLNGALPQLASELRGCVMTFGTDQKYTTKRGLVFDPGMIEPMNKLGKLLNMTTLTGRILGWNKRKKLDVFSNPKCKVYGHITEEDVKAINYETLNIAGVLDNIEVVPDANAFEGYGSSSSSGDADNINNVKE